MTFVLIDQTDQSPAHQITLVVCSDPHAHVYVVGSLTSNHPKRCQLSKFFLSTSNVLGSVKQLSGIVRLFSFGCDVRQ